MEDSLNVFQDMIALTIHEKSSTFETTINNMVDDTIQDVYIAAETAQAAMLDQSTDILNKITQETTQNLSTYNDIMDIKAALSDLQQLLQDLQDVKCQHPPVSTSSTTHPNVPQSPAPRWKNVTLDPTFRRSPNPFDAPQGNVNHTWRPSSNNTNDSQAMPPRRTPTFDNPNDIRNFRHNYKNPADHIGGPSPIPHTVLVGSGAHYNALKEHPGLPPLNHDAALKRAKIQYTGIGDMFVFYNQLLNGMEQFGVFLTPLNQVRYNDSLCPKAYNNVLITEQRYQSMASTLYQKLQNPDVVPLDHTSIRNIINRFAETNDGYQVLYAMLELVHPALCSVRKYIMKK